MSLLECTVDEWQDITRVVYDIRPLGDSSSFFAAIDAKWFDRMICTEVRFSAQEFSHNPARIKGVNHNYLLYERYFSGSGRGMVEDTPTHVDAKSIHLIDMSRHYRSITSDVITAGVCIPHDLVGYDPTRDPPYLTVPVDTPQGRMLDAAHHEFRGMVAQDHPEMGDIASAFSTLVKLLMLKTADTRRDTSSDTEGRPLLRPLLRSYIASRLDDINLAPETICREVGLSRTVLYREFSEDGGVMTFIKDRRLDRCFAELMATPARRGAVRQVAERWGFHHPGNFHRCFRDRFGMSPSDCLEHSMVEASRKPGATYHPIHEWMRAV